MSNFKSMTNSFEIKICGINDKTSMVEAVNSEADYIGFVFYNNSPRNLTLSLAKSLVAFRNKRSKIVALTVNAKDEFISEIKENISPDYFQLHGDEPPERCKDVKLKFQTSVIKGLGIKDQNDLTKNTKRYENICDILILDAPSSNLPGGNGKKFDWNLLKGYSSKTKWMLAGGLNVYNVNDAIKYTNAPAIDVSSGVEISKGVKDPKLIRNFILKCRNFNG
ncbi:phosphoribosylanthranilate isomerase [Alphaproteobacteria bacterium]|jgi:phosphoribosylanthranilate isomerase|nr:phosphoribosylanthranilate isomerase [Alphaproteobacteria bacterium]